jgi:hypothetical protein
VCISVHFKTSENKYFIDLHKISEKDISNISSYDVLPWPYFLQVYDNDWQKPIKQKFCFTILHEVSACLVFSVMHVDALNI